jgi:hypothetical protein
MGSRIRKLDIHGLRFRDMLYQRGHVYAAEPGKWTDEDSIGGMLYRIPGNNLRWSIDKFYDWFSEKTNRNLLKQAIDLEEDRQFPLFNGVVLDSKQVSMRMYSKTFEWYVSELLMQEMRFIASGSSVLLEGAPNGGDYDVLGFSATDLVYMETKSGRPSNISLASLKNFSDRAKFLSPAISILYVDYEKLDIHFNFRDLAKASDASMIYQIADKNSGARLYRPNALSMYVLENQTNGSVIKNLRFLFRAHYALEASQRKEREIDPSRLDQGQFEVQALH